jgi:methylase of polypeptide subunit release factors
VLEVHEARGAEVARQLEAAGYGDVKVSQDLAGRDRIVEGRWTR